MKVAIIGTVGVPAKYGGFETLVENIIGKNCSVDIEYTVFCSSKSYLEKSATYKGANLRYIGLNANGVQSILYDIISIIRSLRKYDVLLILGISGCVVLPWIKWLCKGKIIVNIDGLEHRRNKWSAKVKKFLKLSEKIAVKYADVVITDNKAIQDYVKDEYGKETCMIAYGGDHVSKTGSDENYLTSLGLASYQYGFTVCRIEPENNIHLILEAFSRMPDENMVMVGNWENSRYGRVLKEEYTVFSNIKLLPPIYDSLKINTLRCFCKYYVHGHSAGGTNPSLVEAMFIGRPVFAYDVIFNRKTTCDKAIYFISDVDLITKIRKTTDDVLIHETNELQKIANQHYCWNHIISQYEHLIISE